MTRYQLSIGAAGLPKGGWRTPNPYAEVMVTGGPLNGTTVGKTEVVHCSQNPDFTQVLFIETDTAVFFPIRVAIYNDRNHAELASAAFEATEVHASSGHLQVQKCTNGAG
jgi:C2 domain